MYGPPRDCKGKIRREVVCAEIELDANRHIQLPSEGEREEYFLESALIGLTNADLRRVGPSIRQVDEKRPLHALEDLRFVEVTWTAWRPLVKMDGRARQIRQEMTKDNDR